MVEGVPANMQYDTGAEVCLITTKMVARLGLSQHGEPCWMELTSALGALPVISTRRHRLHFKTGPFFGGNRDCLRGGLHWIAAGRV